jgi:hypothetical protein
VLMDQSSQDNTLAGVRPPPVTAEDAVSHQSSQDKRRKRSSEAPVREEGSAISTAAQRGLGPRPGREAFSLTPAERVANRAMGAATG